MLSNFFTGFDIPSIFNYDDFNRISKKFDKHFNKRTNFLNDWTTDFDLFHQPSAEELKEAKLKSIKRQEEDNKKRQKAAQEYLEELKKQEEDLHTKHDKISKMEIKKDKKKQPSALRTIFGSDDELDKLFNEYTRPKKKVQKENKKSSENLVNEEKKTQTQTMEEEKQPLELTKEQSIARQEENNSRLDELKQKLTEQGFKCKANDQNDQKDWIVGKKKFLNENNEKEKQVFYQIHDKKNPNCNYSGYSKQVRDDDGNFSAVKKSVYHYEKCE